MSNAPKAIANPQYPRLAQMDSAKLSKESSRFLIELSAEGERSAIVMGASRLEVELENLIKGFMNHNPDGDDNLFDIDKPLGTFSAKISLAYRLGLIDSKIEHTLQMIRKTRNDFAHACSKIDIASSPHKERIAEMENSAKISPHYSGLHELLSGDIKNPILLDYCTTISLLLMIIIGGYYASSPIKPSYTCLFER
jgi:hypothetical protein